MTARPIAVVTSDCHLADKTWTGRASLTGDAYFGFKQCVDYAIEHDVPLIAAGDLIDKPRNESPPLQVLSEQLARLREAELQFVFIQGQHELQAQPWVLTVAPWATHLEVENFELAGGHIVGGFDWAPADVVRSNLEYIEENRDIDILVMHQVMHEWMGGITAAEMSFDQIPHVNMLIVGDYHEISGTQNHHGKDGQPLQVLSPGSTCLQSITEPEHKYCYLLYDNYTYEQLPLLTRVILKPPELLTEETLHSFVENVEYQISSAVEQATHEKLPEALIKPILYVRFSTELDRAFQRIERAVGGEAHLFLKELRPEPTHEQKHARQLREQVLEHGLIGCLQEVAPDEDSARYRLAYRLLNTQTPRAELYAMRNERLGLSEEEAE